MSNERGGDTTIKKRYLLILSLAVGSVLVARSPFHNNVTQAQKGKEPTQVDIRNLPIDKQGDLKAAIVQSSKIVLVYNESLTVPSDPNNYIYLTSFETTEYKYAYIVAPAQGTWTQGVCTINILSYDNNFGTRTMLSPGFALETAGAHLPHYGTGNTSIKFELHSTTIDIYLQVYGSEFEGLLTAAVHLSNWPAFEKLILVRSHIVQSMFAHRLAEVCVMLDHRSSLARLSLANCLKLV